MKHILIFILISGFVCASGATFTPPFRAEAMAFYFVHDGGPLQLCLKVRPDSGNRNNPMYLRKDAAFVGRIFNADEKLVEWDYRKIKAGSETLLRHDFGDNAPPGIYQIRYSGANVLVTPYAVPEKKFGLAPLRCMVYAAVADQFADTWFYVPENASTLCVSLIGGKAVVTDAQGKTADAVHPGDVQVCSVHAQGLGVFMGQPVGGGAVYPVHALGRGGVQGLAVRRCLQLPAGVVDSFHGMEFFLTLHIQPLQRAAANANTANMLDPLAVTKNKRRAGSHAHDDYPVTPRLMPGAKTVGNKLAGLVGRQTVNGLADISRADARKHDMLNVSKLYLVIIQILAEGSVERRHRVGGFHAHWRNHAAVTYTYNLRRAYADIYSYDHSH